MAESTKGSVSSISKLGLDEIPDNLPLPFAPALSHELFGITHDDQQQQQDFDPSTFLLNRKHVNLDDLRSELRTYLASLRQQLVAIINSDYEDFINLGGSHLLGSDDQMSYRMRKPLEGISKEIREAMDELVAVQAGLDNQLAKREDVRSRKATCRKLLAINEQIQKVEEMLLINNAAFDSDKTDEATKVGLKAIQTRRPSHPFKPIDRSMGSDSKRLERIAQEFNQLLYLVRKAQDLKFVLKLQPRIDRISLTLQQDLSSQLSSMLAALHESLPSSSVRDITSTLKARTEALNDVFRTHASIDKFREAEEVVRRQLVSDFVVRTIHREALLSPQSPMMPITPFAGLASSGVASPPASAFPFSSLAQGSSSVIDDRSMIPPFYIIEPIPAIPAAATADTYISDALVDLYNKLFLFISKELGVVLELTERRPTQGREAASAVQGRDGDVTVPGSPSTRDRSRPSLDKAGFEMLSNVVWNEIANRLMNELSHLIFSAGRPDTFHRNYRATMTFISRLEGLCPNYRYLMLLRNNPIYIAFMRRWQLPVYFQLRFKEIVGSLENSLSGNIITPAPSAVQSTRLILSASEAVHRAIRLCWNDDIYLPELSGRFWRLSLQILRRFETWLDSSLPDHHASVNGQSATATQATASGSSLQRLLPAGLPNAGSRPSTPNPAVTQATDDQSDETALRQISIVASDAFTLQALILQMFREDIAPRLPKSGSGAIAHAEGDDDTAEATISAALSSITAKVPALLVQAVIILARRCSEPLRLVRSGASQVRANTRSKGGSTEPSYFVANILRPAKAFFEGSGRVMSAEHKNQVASEVFEDIAIKYEAALSKMKKDGDALRRIKKGKAGFSLFGSRSSANEDSANASEDEKVRQQMGVDVEAFAQDAQTLGVDTAKSEALKALRAVIDDWNK